jgi:hypothetical protein
MDKKKIRTVGHRPHLEFEKTFALTASEDVQQLAAAEIQLKLMMLSKALFENVPFNAGRPACSQ